MYLTQKARKLKTWSSNKAREKLKTCHTCKARRLTNQVFMFYKIYTGLVGISLPPEVVCNTRASRLPNCAPFCQLATLNDTYKYSFYPRAIRTWNSLPLALIPNSLDEFKVTISSM